MDTSMKKGVMFSVTLSLLVTTVLINTSSQSDVKVQPGPVTVKQGRNVTLWCKPEHNPKNGVPVLWQSPPNFKTRTSECNSFEKKKYHISCGGGWHNMTIVDVQWDDKGKYRCIHTGDTGVVDLQVLVPVTNVSITHNFEHQSKDNFTAELTCITNCAYPTPKISWFKNDQTFKSSVVNTEMACTDDTEGPKRARSIATVSGKYVDKAKKESTIYCKTEDVFSKTIDAMTGTSSLRIKVQPGPVEVNQGNNVTLWCKLVGESKIRAPVLWQTPPNFNTISEDCTSYMEKKYVISCAGSHHLRWFNMTIVDAQWLEKGQYRCISSVNHEIVNLQVLVPVTKMSLTHVPRSENELLFLDKDNDAELTCTTNCAYPAPSISWFENNQPFNGSTKILITESGCTGKKKGQKRTISMVKVTGKNVGEERKQSSISCTAGNHTASKVSRTVNVRYNALLTGVRFQNTSTGPAKVKQGNNISLWCKLIDDSANDVPVHWQSPPEFTTRTSNCDTFGPSLDKQKYVMSCAESGDRSYNMTVMDVQWTDKGRYRCVHTREMGIVELQVLVPVTNVSLKRASSSEKKPMMLDKESDAVLNCTTNCAFPAPIISWFENDHPFNGSTKVIIIESGCTGDKTGQKQTISTATVKGKYVDKEAEESIISCVAENVIGEKNISEAIVITHVTPSPPQPVMAIGGTIAAVVVAVLVVISTIVVVVVVVHRKKGVQENAEELIALLRKEEPLGCSIIYEYDDTSATPDESITFLGDLLAGLRKHSFEVDLREVKQRGDGTVSSKVLEEPGQTLQYKKVILDIPKNKNTENQLVHTFNEVVERGRERARRSGTCPETRQEEEQNFVAVMILTAAFQTLPSKLRSLQRDWKQNGEQTQKMATAREEFVFLQAEPNPLQLDLMHLTLGLSWTYYHGYLANISQIFKETLENPRFHEDLGKRMSKQMFIVFTTNCRTPKIMNSDRVSLKLSTAKKLSDRAGVQRYYNLDVQEFKSNDENNMSYYGVVCFLDFVHSLSEMMDDPNKIFFRFDKDDMRTYGKDCFENLKLNIRYNQRIGKEQSSFDFIEFNTEAENADENDLADDIYNRIKQSCTSETRNAVQEGETTDDGLTGVLCDYTTIDTSIKEFVDDLTNADRGRQITGCRRGDGRTKFGLELIERSKRIFTVLNDEFVKSEAFPTWFYTILDKGFRQSDRRFLVFLDCLSQEAKKNIKVRDLKELFTSVNYTDEDWPDKVRNELQGEVHDINYEKQFKEIGAGFALSWYYSILRIQIPKVRDVINHCHALRVRFFEGRMSEKVFILSSQSGFCPETVSEADKRFEPVDNNEIKLPHIMKEGRDYTPKVYCLKDKDGEEYYAFLEFSTVAQAELVCWLQKEGYLGIPETEKMFKREVKRFYDTMGELLAHPEEPMDIKNRMVILNNEDKNVDLHDTVLAQIKKEIQTSNEKLPEPIDNGAAIEFKQWEKKPALGPSPSTGTDANA